MTGATDRGEIRQDDRVIPWLLEPAEEADDGPLVILAHGAGAPMFSEFMQLAASGLRARGLPVARFHFPYMERMQREGGRRPPDRAPVLLDAWRAVLDLDLAGGRPVIAAGKSLGGRMASMLLAEARAPEVVGAVYLGYPLHPRGRTDRLRDAHLEDVPTDQLFVQGTRDDLCDLALLRPVLDRLGPAARLHVVEGGDHSLVVAGPDRRTATEWARETWLDAVAAFCREVAS